MITEAIRTRIFIEGEDLIDFIREYIPKVEEGMIIVITSKIVALSESRTFVASNREERLRYIQSESSWCAETRYVYLTIRDRMPMANAGIDESNGNGRSIMLPEDSYQSAYTIWETLRTLYGVKNLGIIITDSRTLPFRRGTIGISLGHMGFEAIRDYAGKMDIFGRPFQFANTNIPDALAVAAVHLMGEGDECQPLATIHDPHCTWSEERQSGDDVVIDPEDDMYRPIFQTDHMR